MDIKKLAKETDKALADIHGQINALNAQIDARMDSAHTHAGDRKDYRGRSRKGTWRMDDAEVIDRIVNGEIITPQYLDKARRFLAERDAMIEQRDALEADATDLEILHSQHRWARFFLVPGGHIHSGTQCAGGTIRITTSVGWLPDLSGKPIADAVAAHGTILCTHCFPTAPVEWRVGPPKVEDPSKCESQNLGGDRSVAYRRRRGVCGDCGAQVTLTLIGNVRKHKRP